MCSSPQRLCDDIGGVDTSSGKTRSDATDFLDGPADQRRVPGFMRRIVFGGAADRVVSDCGQHGEGEHDQGDVAMPAVPGTGFVVVETEFVLGGFETVLGRGDDLRFWDSVEGANQIQS